MNLTVNPTDHPLLQGSGLPDFTNIKPEHVVPAITQLLAELEQELTSLEANLVPTWNGFVQPLESLRERLNWSWGVVSHCVFAIPYLLLVVANIPWRCLSRSGVVNPLLSLYSDIGVWLMCLSLYINRNYQLPMTISPFAANIFEPH